MADRNPGEVVLVCGPPAAGKSTWVKAQAGPADRIIDLDQLCRSLGSRARYDHPQRVRQLAKAMRRSLEDKAAEHPGRTWVIRSLPKAEDRAAVAERLNARVVMHAVPADEAIARARGDQRPPWTEEVIRGWWDNYQPSPVDETP
jgi:energy-coupling factor transporter ATP-binding protein EcfA2